MRSQALTGVTRGTGVLPTWTSLLAVVAHPDDESFGLGAILDGFVVGGARVEVLCLTHGEASRPMARPRRCTEPPESSPRFVGLSWPRRPRCLG